MAGTSFNIFCGTCTLVTLPSAWFCAHTAPRFDGTWAWAIAAVLWASSMYNLIRTCFTDAGILPANRSRVAPPPPAEAAAAPDAPEHERYKYCETCNIWRCAHKQSAMSIYNVL